MLDRGPDSRKVMDLLMRLEGEASKTGGRVHVLIGNHEAMNVYGVGAMSRLEILRLILIAIRERDSKNITSDINSA